MLQRYLTLDKVPELRSEPSSSEKSVPEVEILVPVEVYWEIEGLIKKISYARQADVSCSKQWQDLARLVHTYIVTERDRLWFAKNVGGC
jgi:hypothetical protein